MRADNYQGGTLPLLLLLGVCLVEPHKVFNIRLGAEEHRAALVDLFRLDVQDTHRTGGG